MLDSIYNMTLNYFEIVFVFVQTLRFGHIYAVILPASIRNVTKICKPLVVYLFYCMTLIHSQATSYDRGSYTSDHFI